MSFVQLTCPNCNGRIENKNGKTFKCPFCETELLLKENHVYFVDQTINHYHGTPPKAPAKSSVKILLPIILMLAGLVGIYYYANLYPPGQTSEAVRSVQTIPESEVLISFLQEIFNKGTAMPTMEEIAQVRYLNVSYNNDQWHFTYSLDDPFSNAQADLVSYVTRNKTLNNQRIEQKDFEAFSGLVALDLMGTYEISKSKKTSFAHMQGLQSYGGSFNESFNEFATYFGDKSKVVELTTQIRSNNELALLLAFPNLKSLAITYVDESVTDFHLLNQLPLHTLSLTFVDQLDWLSSLSGLKSLTIVHSEAVDFSALYALTQLQELKLSALPNLKTMDFVQNMPALQTLDIEQTNLANLSVLTDKASITKLRLASMSNLGSVAFVNTLRSLKELGLSGYYSETTPLELPHAQSIEVPGSFVPDLKAPALTALTIVGGSKELNGAELGKFPQLEQLTLLDTDNFFNIRALDQLAHLQTLNVYDIYFFKETTALFSLQHVKNLICTECTLNVKAGETVANDSLEHLTLNQTSFNIDNTTVNEVDKVLPYFAGMVSLRSFTMQDSTIADLQFMSSWQAVEKLHLENNAISNIEPLAHLPKLQKLFITGNPVQNKSVLEKRVVVY